MCCRPRSVRPSIHRQHPDTPAHHQSANGHFSLPCFPEKEIERRRRRERYRYCCWKRYPVPPPPPPLPPPFSLTGFRHFWVTLGHKMIRQSDTRALFLLPVFVARRLNLHILLLLLYIYVSFALSLVCVLYALPNDNNNISSRIIFGLQPNHILLPSPLMPPTPFYYLQIQKASPFVHFLGLCDGLKLIFPQHFNRPTAWLNILSVLFESHYNRWRRRLLNIIRHVCVVIVGKKRRTTNHGARIIHAHVHTTPSSVNLLHRLCNSKRRRK